MTQSEPTEISSERETILERIYVCTTEIDRLDFGLVASRKTGSGPPSDAEVFGALAEAATVCADAIEEAAENPITVAVREAVVILQVSVVNLATSLKTYAMLVVCSDEP